MSGLGLVPNEIAGYRLRADWYSWNVLLVKRHGAGSKAAGTEYETTLAYCRSLPYAVEWMLDHATRLHGARNQADNESAHGSIAQAQAVVDAVAAAKADVLAALAHLQAEMGSALPETAPKATLARQERAARTEAAQSNA